MFSIDSHYNGPPGMGHGGVSAGRFAALVEPDAARVRFRRPIPLDVALTTTYEDGIANIHAGEELVATARALDGPLEIGPFPSMCERDLHLAEQRWLEPTGGRHMAPACFACGHLRDLGGLGLRPGPIPGPDGTTTGVIGCRWRPEGSGRVPAWMIWAALDCPTGFPAFASTNPDEAVVTAELSVHVIEPVHAGQTMRILSRRVAKEGRRHHTEACLLGPDGRRYAVASAIWCTVPIASFAAAA
ncbi:MAG: PaaI family thioesterase [Ilumatobacter sp.]